jgi:mannose-6-phosphate isomerase-like protein (cupin superfamily)
VDPDFWERIQERKELHEGRLVILSHQSGTMMHWEVHPGGDELLYLLSGRIDVVLETENTEQVVNLQERTAVIVPRGVWHTLRVHTPGDLLSITRGEGAQIRSAHETP